MALVPFDVEGEVSSAASALLSVGSTFQPGDLRVVRVSGPTARTFTGSAGWTVLSNDLISSSRRVTVWARVLQAGDTAGTVTFDTTSNYERQAFTVRGWDAAGQNLTAVGGSSASVTALVAPSLTAPAAGALFTFHSVTRTASAASTTITDPGSMTRALFVRTTNTAGYATSFCYEQVPAGATGTRTATASGSGTWTTTSLFVPEPVQVSGQDSGTGSESGFAARKQTGQDTGTGSETGFAAEAKPGGDTGTSTESGQVSATSQGSDAGAGSDAGSVRANVTAPTNTGSGSESGRIRIPGSDVGAGSDTLARLDADVRAGDSGSGSDGGFVEALYADLVISLYAVHPTTGALVPLPDFTKLTLSPQRNSAGSITVDYPSTGINFALLRDTITGDRDLEVEVWNFGSPDGALRGYLQEAAGDDVAEDAGWTFAGGFLELRMAEALVWPQPLTGETTLGPNVDVAKSSVTAAQWNRFLSLGYQPSTSDPNTLSAPQKVVDAVKANAASIPVLADPKRELKFEAVTPGAAVGFMMAQARNRGALTDIAWDFTSAKDSAGVTWPKTLTTKFSPGASYDQVLGKFAQLGLIEWSVQWTGTQKVLRMWVQGGRGVDRTTGLRPVVLRAGRNILEAPRKWSVKDSDTAMLSVGAEGFYGEASSVDAQTRRGRRIEATASANSLITQDAVDAYAQWQLGVSTSGTLEVTHGIGFLPGEPRPLIAFDVGDHVYSQTGTALDRLRVVQWTLSVDAGQNPSGTVTLNDMVQDALSKQQARLDAIASGDTVVGTSEQSQQQSTGVPEAPTGLLISSGAFNQGIDAYALVNLAWTAPSINTNGTALTDLGGFRVEWTENANPTSWRFAADVGPQQTSAQWTVAVGLPILYRVRAYNTSGRSSVWTTGTTAHTTETDSTPPGVPSTPVGGGGLGLVDFRWDGKTSDGADMLQAHPDLKWVELHLSTGSNFTPSAATLADTIFGAGTYSYSQLPDGTSLGYSTTYFCRLVAVDRLDNKSAPSSQGSALPGQVLSPDIFDGAVGTAKLADAAIVEAKIANLAVTEAKIQSMSVGKLTAGSLTASMIVSTGKIGTRAAGSTGAGWEGDSAGIRLYNASNQITVQLSGANGSAMVAGEYRTSLTTGRRMVFNPNGTQPDEIRFYPSNTNQYARMLTVDSGDSDYPNQAGIQIAAYSARSDGFSGSIRLFPEYTSMEWGVSYVQCSPNQMGLRAPRFHFGMPRSSGFGVGDDETLRFGVTNFSAGSFIEKTVISYNLNSADIPSWRNVNQNSGLEFGPGFVGSIRGDSSGYNPIRASAFQTFTSLRKTKQDFEDLVDPLGQLRAAPVQRWRRIQEVERYGDAAERHIGAMADDLPPEVVRGEDGTDVVGYALESLVGLVHGGVNQLAAQVDELHARLVSLEGGR